MIRIPVVLVTGFLGSGKTTLLLRLAEAYPDQRLVFLVNEFAAIDVDGETLTATGTPTHSVVGGSLFCECKAGDFIRTMREKVLSLHRQRPVDCLIIETSGMADPHAIGHIMHAHGLERFFELRRIATVVAPGTLSRLLGNLPVVEAQLKTSDLIIINKIDTVSPAAVAVAESVVRRLNPDAEVVLTEQCRFEFLIPLSLRKMPNGELSTCDANPFCTLECEWPPERSVKEARHWLQALSPKILRVKGSIRTPEGHWQVERTMDGLEMSPSQPKEALLVLIAHDDDEAQLELAKAGLKI